jgi:hypothetical protein
MPMQRFVEKKMSVEIEHPPCVICDRQLTYVKGIGWFCRVCDADQKSGKR